MGRTQDVAVLPQSLQGERAEPMREDVWPVRDEEGRGQHRVLRDQSDEGQVLAEGDCQAVPQELQAVDASTLTLRTCWRGILLQSHRAGVSACVRYAVATCVRVKVWCVIYS